MLFVLMYHSIVKNEDIASNYDVSIDEFKSQMEFIKASNYKTVSTRDIVDRDDAVGKDVSVMITFDDGYADNFFNAFKILSEFKMPATFFITTGWIENRAGMMSWEEIKKMSARGMAIESHAHTHRFLTDLKNEDISSELKISKEMIKEKTGLDCHYFSCPGGRINKKIMSIARDLNIQGIFTSAPGINEGEADNRYIYNRILVNKNITFGEFKEIFNKKDRDFLADRCFYKFKNMLKSIMGNEAYYGLWSKINKK